MKQETKKQVRMPDANLIENEAAKKFGDDLTKVLVENFRKAYDDIKNLFDTPSFSVHKNGSNQTGVADATATKVTWGTEEWDSHGNFASDKFTPLTVGKYLLTAHVHLTVSVDNSPLVVAIYKNGALYRQVETVMASTPDQGAHISCIVDADGVDDYFEVYVTQTTGGAKIIDGTATRTWFQGCKLPVSDR